MYNLINIYIIYLYSVPKVEHTKDQWLNIILQCGGKLEKLKSESVLCSAHFEQNCFLQYVRRKVLKENAIPTIIIKRIKSVITYLLIYKYNYIINLIEIII